VRRRERIVCVAVKKNAQGEQHQGEVFLIATCGIISWTGETSHKTSHLPAGKAQKEKKNQRKKISGKHEGESGLLGIMRKALKKKEGGELIFGEVRVERYHKEKELTIKNKERQRNHMAKEKLLRL